MLRGYDFADVTAEIPQPVKGSTLYVTVRHSGFAGWGLCFADISIAGPPTSAVTSPRGRTRHAMSVSSTNSRCPSRNCGRRWATTSSTGPTRPVGPGSASGDRTASLFCHITRRAANSVTQSPGCANAWIGWSVRSIPSCRQGSTMTADAAVDATPVRPTARPLPGGTGPAARRPSSPRPRCGPAVRPSSF